VTRFLFVIGCFCAAGCLAAAEAEKPAATNSALNLSEFTSAESLWAYIEKQQDGPTTQPKTREEAHRIFSDYLNGLEASTSEFVKRYPQDVRRWEARLMRCQAQMGLASLQKTTVHTPERETELKEIASATDAPAKARTDARAMLIQVHLNTVKNPSSKLSVAEVDAEIESFHKDYPEDPRSGPFQMARVTLLEKSNPEKADAILREVAKSKDPELSQAAQAQLAQRELKTKPLELTFTALDGSTVDMAALRGKVVLVDFWATWCGPCRREMPNLIATYKKLNHKGFEIVGISLDKDKEKLLAMLKENQMTWPQYYDGKGWENNLSRRYGVTSIPAQWLVDKKGFVRNTNARHGLESEVEKLLAE
jgi:thiol-disulfide isomerase/thioredoxin